MNTHTQEAGKWFVRAFRSTLEANNAGDDGVDISLARLAEQAPLHGFSGAVAATANSPMSMSAAHDAC